MNLTKKAEPIEISGLNDTYKTVCELVGAENMLRLYEQYRGLQVMFPTRLYDKAYVREVIRKEFNGSNAHELAKRFNYSERWIRSIIAAEGKEEPK